jgi:toxin ParE1/3/4
MAPKRREVRWSEAAGEDLWSIVEFIARDRPSTADEVLLRIQKRAESLRHTPEKGRRVPELERQGVREYRELVISVWRLFYKVTPSTIEILALFDSRRNLEDLLLLRLTRRH